MIELKSVALSGFTVASQINVAMVRIITGSDTTEAGDYIPAQEIILSTEQIKALADTFLKKEE